MKLLTLKNLCFFATLALAALSFGQAASGETLPTIVLSANETISGMMQPGLPLVVSALSTVAEGNAPNLPTSLKIKVSDDKGTRLELALTRITRANETNQFYWMAGDTATSSLRPGQYTISVDESAGKLTGWALQDCDLNVDPSDDSNTDLKAEMNIEILLLQNKPDDALTIATALTQKNPKNINAWVALGDIYMAQNKLEKAVDAYRAALANFNNDGHEPLSILRRYSDALNRLMGTTTSPPLRVSVASANS